MLLVSLLPSTAIGVPAGEHQIKAAMIYNMAKFADWSADNLPVNQQQFVICVLGKGRLSNAVETLQAKPVRGRNIVVREITQASEASNCQMLIIGESELRQIPAILEKTRNSRIMTISDTDGFAKAGGVVGFFVEDNKVRLEINLATVQRHKLRIDAQVLKLSRIVRDQP